MALWLEEQKIRHYPAEARGPLRQLDSDQWPAAYQKYLEQLAAPVSGQDTEGALDWLLGRAVRLVSPRSPSLSLSLPLSLSLSPLSPLSLSCYHQYDSCTT